MEKNRFSVLLERLVNTAEVKHSLLAQEVRFDVSYISKWVNGRVLPSEKNIEDTVNKISGSLVNYASENGVAQLFRDYQVTQKDELQAAIYQNLIAEYYYVVQLQQDKESFVSQNISFYPWLSMGDFLGKIHHPILRRVKNLDIMAAVDLFSIQNEYRIRSVSQGVDATAINYEYPDVHFYLLIDQRKIEEDIVRNILFISNMMRMLSHVDFRLYSGEFAGGKFIFVVKNELAVSGILIRPDTCASVAVCEGSENAQPLFQCMQSLCTRETLMFQKLDIMDALVHSKDYVRALLAPGRSWLMGHMTELLMPADLFQELAVKSRLAQSYSMEELLRLNKISEGILSNPSLRILINESAISQFVVTGEVDFFTEILTLNCEQRIRVLNCFLEQVKNIQAQIKVIDTPAMSEFEYDVMPSVFLSGTLSFLRLRSINQKDNLLLKINRKDVQALHKKFIDHLWAQNEHDVPDVNLLEHLIAQQLQGLQLLADAGRAEKPQVPETE